ncbi:MAG: T9SS type A sorting domain-containing protein, partial [Duncaniella sp.]|nr:T9SS type A sorting domain-containing protein [Duncaniella sp.]
NDSAIYVTSQHQVSVKVFTILGQLISQETLPAGTHRLQMSAKGIYILKIGTNITRRVTI